MKDQSLPQQSRNSGRECAWWTNSLVGQYIHQLSLEQSSRCRQSHGQDIILLSFFSGGTSLCFTDQETQEENVHTWWTNSLVGQYLNQLSLAHSSRSIQHMQTVLWPKQSFCLSFFREDQSLLHRPRNSGRECAWWTNSLVGQYLHQLSLVQSSRSIQSMQTVPWSKQFFSQFF